jgi:hypothetical protein
LYYIDCSSEFDFMTDEREREREVLGKNKKWSKSGDVYSRKRSKISTVFFENK